MNITINELTRDIPENAVLAEKLRLSTQGMETVTMREIRCPYCQFLIDIVGSDVREGHKLNYCRKCKRRYIINFSHFRVQRRFRYRQHVR